MGRAPCCEKKGLKRGRWAVEEDEILVKYIEKYGEGSWKSLPKNAGLLRCGKSCRLRWINYLRADLKRGNISTEEEEIIIKLHSKIGNRWSLIAAQLPGRTDNEIKNYWNSHLSRRLHYFHRLTIDDTFIFDFGSVSDSGKRRGGRTSRASMMKNSVFMLKANGSTIKGQSLKQNQTSHNIKGPDIATSSSAPKEKECRNPNFDFDMESQNTAVEMKGKIEEEEEEEEELAAMEGDELVKVMAEMEKVLMADLEEAKLWEDAELEVWPWLWEMTGEGGSLDDESLDVIW